MRATPRRTGLYLVGLLVASLAVVAQSHIHAQSQDVPPGTRPDVGTVRGTLVFGAAARPDAGSDAWIFAGRIQFPPDCAIFSSTFELTIGDCATGNRSVAFLKHTRADGRGAFAVSDLPIGDYTLVLRSAHAGGTEKRDLANKIVISWFSLKGGDVVDASMRF